MSSTVEDRVKMRRVAFGTMAGAGIEWYDFYVFGVAAALVLNKIFFANVPPAVGTLLAFGTFAAAWVARPLGGLIFSHLGDRIGRKRVMLYTLVLMGCATTAIGLLPDYNTIGPLAPILLITLRLLQGLASGGEWGAATVTAVESAPAGKHGLFGAFPQMGVPVGLMLSSLVSLIFYSLPDEQLLSWGWRIPFLLTLVFVLVGQFIRRKLPESEEFIKLEARGEISRFPLGEAVKKYWRAILVVLFTQAIVNVGFYTTTTFILDYSTNSGWFPRTTVLGAVAIAAFLDIFIVLAGGMLADKYGARRIMLIGIIGTAFAFLLIFPLVASQSMIAMGIAIVVLWPIVHGLAHGAQPTFFASLFPARVRLTGMSAGYQFCGIVFSGPAPIIATLLIGLTGSFWLFIAYIFVVGTISTLAVLRGKPEDRSVLATPSAQREVPMVPERSDVE